MCQGCRGEASLAQWGHWRAAVLLAGIVLAFVVLAIAPARTWLDRHQGSATIAGALIASAVALYYTLLTRDLVAGAQQQRRDAARPIVVFGLDEQQDRVDRFGLRLMNAGPGVALDVTVVPTSDLLNYGAAFASQPFALAPGEPHQGEIILSSPTPFVDPAHPTHYPRHEGDAALERIVEENARQQFVSKRSPSAQEIIEADALRTAEREYEKQRNTDVVQAIRARGEHPVIGRVRADYRDVFGQCWMSEVQITVAGPGYWPKVALQRITIDLVAGKTGER